MKYINVFETAADLQAVKEKLAKPQLAYVSADGTVCNISSEPIPTVNFIDLGLSSGTKWASCNVGATCSNTSTSWFGNYYAWGETQIKTTYSGYPEGSYKYGILNYETYPEVIQLTKYNQLSQYGKNGYVDILTTLEATDDAATVNQQYNMPTKDQIDELIEETNSSWVTNYNNVNDLNGMLFISKTIANASIFIPAAGDYTNSDLYRTGISGKIWSSTLYSDMPGNAYNCYFNSAGSWTDFTYRYYGFSIRGVQSK